MKLPLQQFGYEASEYERPNQTWVCGWHSEGDPCSIGPDKRGRCPALGFTTCTPRKTESGYQCTRLYAFGGKCAEGPRPDGSCCNPTPKHAPCHPVLSLRAKRHRFVAVLFAAGLAYLILMLCGPEPRRFISPGPLSAAHASLSHTTGDVGRCSVCHESNLPEDQVSFLVPLAMAVGHANDENCINCHYSNDIPARQHARQPHGFHLEYWTPPPANEQPATATKDGKPQFAQILSAAFGMQRNYAGKIGCIECHKEHRDPAAKLMPDQTSCNACHGQQFVSFSRGHPDIKYTSAFRGIAFNHSTHARADHFGSRQFRCSDCHQPDEDNRRMTLPTYEQACANCHASGTKDHHGKQIANINDLLVFQMPDPDDFDAEPGFPPIMSMLLSADAATRKVLQSIPEDYTLAEYLEDEIEDDDLREQSRQTIMKQSEMLHQELTSRDLPALRKRLATLLDADEASPVVSMLSTNLVDPRLNRTDKAVSYEPTGHADTWLTRWIDASINNFGSSHPDTSHALEGMHDYLDQVAGNACIRCHTKEPGKINWQAARREVRPWAYQKFTHRSHLMALGEKACSNCHQLATEPDPAADIATLRHGLRSYTTQRCATCHTTERRIENCLTCHTYHKSRP